MQISTRASVRDRRQDKAYLQVIFPKSARRSENMRINLNIPKLGYCHQAHGRGFLRWKSNSQKQAVPLKIIKKCCKNWLFPGRNSFFFCDFMKVVLFYSISYFSGQEDDKANVMAGNKRNLIASKERALTMRRKTRIRSEEGRISAEIIIMVENFFSRANMSSHCSNPK